MFGRRKEVKPEAHPKYLGIFGLEEVDPQTKAGATLAKMYKKAGVVQNEQRPFIDLHVRPGASLQNLGAHAIRQSLGLVADYVSAHPDKLAGQDIVGVTYPKLGKLATRFGFDVQEVDGDKLPQQLAGRVNAIASEHGYASRAPAPPQMVTFEDGTPNYSAQGDEDTHVFGEFAAVSQSSDDLIKRFGSQNEE